MTNAGYTHKTIRLFSYGVQVKRLKRIILYLVCKSAPRIVSRVDFGKAAQMVDGLRTVNPVHKKLSGFESLSSHKINLPV